MENKDFGLLNEEEAGRFEQFDVEETEMIDCRASAVAGGLAGAAFGAAAGAAAD